jgi:Zn-dependent protease
LFLVLFGFPVRVHPMFWLVGVLLGYQLGGLLEVLVWLAALFVSILCHELGHAVLMRAYGFRPRIMLYAWGGLTAYNSGEGPRTARLTPLRHILISLAGPLAGFLLAGAVAGAIILSGHGDQLLFVGWRHIRPVVIGLHWELLEEFINHLFYICVFWGLVNLLPIQPLDGGHITRDLLMLGNPQVGYRQSLILSVVVAGGLAIIGAVQWQNWLVAIFFGMLAYESLMLLQADMGRRY